MVEFRILGAGRSQRKITALDFRRADFGLFDYLCSGVPWDKAPQVKSGKLGNSQG